jgi:hypothetical protein
MAAGLTAAGGSSSLVQVRYNGRDPLEDGGIALIVAYDADGAFFPDNGSHHDFSDPPSTGQL